MSKKKLKLFVWEGDGVLTDYSSGLVCVLAYDFQEALEKLNEKCSFCTQQMPIHKYKVITKPEAFYCWGGS